MKGYKAFNKDWTCKGFQYEVGKTYELPEGKELKICKSGFHFCKNPIDVFGYYKFGNCVIAVIEALGEIVQDGTMYATDKITIVKEITMENIEALIEMGLENIGMYNTGDSNIGKYNSGIENIGDYNAGVNNIGCYNYGDNNYGWCNTGLNNIGNHNTGYYNIGNYNNGDYNTGKFNTGKFNIGDYNTGMHNIGNFNTGAKCIGYFNTKVNTIKIFDIDTGMTDDEFFCSLDYDFIKLQKHIYEKSITEEDKKYIKELPNFDPVIFEEITGIKIE